MTNVAVVLSGCGVFDGAEIHESVCAMLALTKAGATYQCVAPNIEQQQVINHLTQQESSETRNVLVESARIARGNVIDIAKASINDFDAAIYPGGFGAAKNLCSYAFEGVDHTVQSDVLKFAKAMANAGKPQAFMCIAPVMISKIYGPGVKHTIGYDKKTAAHIHDMGGVHVDCDVDKAVVDTQHKVVSTPAYMLAQSIADVEHSAAAAVKELLSLVV